MRRNQLLAPVPGHGENGLIFLTNSEGNAQNHDYKIADEPGVLGTVGR